MSIAIIRFVPLERGGRSAPPTNADGYSTTARFESDVSATQGHWSVVLRDVVHLRGPECIRADVRFLTQDAPDSLLNEGERFELLEGKRVVAKGVVLPSRIQTPGTINDFELALLG